MMPTTDNVSTQPTVPIARDRFDAPLSLARKQTDVTPVLHQFEDCAKRTGHFQRLVEQGSVYIKGTVYVLLSCVSRAGGGGGQSTTGPLLVCGCL